MKTMLVLFWLAAFGLIFLGAVFWIADRPDVCVSSMMVEAGGETITNPVTCR